MSIIFWERFTKVTTGVSYSTSNDNSSCFVTLASIVVMVLKGSNQKWFSQTTQCVFLPLFDQVHTDKNNVQATVNKCVVFQKISLKQRYTMKIQYNVQAIFNTFLCCFSKKALKQRCITKIQYNVQAFFNKFLCCFEKKITETKVYYENATQCSSIF